MADAAVERAYALAIAHVVTPGAVVLDLGGGFGRRAVRACQSGAARVYTVQPPATADVARAAVRDNGCRDRVEVLEALPASAPWLDAVAVVIAEDPGGLPVHGASLTRHGPRGLPPWPSTAITIPRRESLRAAVVAAPDRHARHVRPWDDLAPRWDFSLARRLASNVYSSGAFDARQLLTEPRSWATVDYGSAAGADRTTTAVLEWRMEQGGVGHGVAIWPSVELAAGVTVSNEPGTAVAHLGHAFFPWLEPVALVPGDQVIVALRVEALAKGLESCLWNWTTTVVGVGHPASRGRRFVQSTFLGSLELLKMASGPVG